MAEDKARDEAEEAARRQAEIDKLVELGTTGKVKDAYEEKHGKKEGR